ncbi:hypothetical protein RZS08_12510, partial [Arthrospira platensis SPKY1]|nr:hypothetical protein [Arthrospira platensis SPKY1]
APRHAGALRQARDTQPPRPRVRRDSRRPEAQGDRHGGPVNQIDASPPAAVGTTAVTRAMKIKRLCASNIREAMRKVREELGSEAVILSNQRTASGFEIVAAVDYDEQLLQGARQQAVATGAAARHRAPAPEAGTGPRKEGSTASEPAPAPATPTAADPAPAEFARGEKPRVVWSQDPLLVEMQN